ncbi:protein kinase domain-containing protein [Tanacetum coccineum]
MRSSGVSRMREADSRRECPVCIISGGPSSALMVPTNLIELCQWTLKLGGRGFSGWEIDQFHRYGINAQGSRYIYIYGAATGETQVYENPITYTIETPNYTAPELIYQTQRSMGPLAKRNDVIFMIFINNQTAEEEADLFYWTKGSGYPVFKDYVLFVNNPDGHRSKQDLWLAMHPSKLSYGYLDGYLNGLEAFKLSINRNLSSPNPELRKSVYQPPSPVSPIKENKKNPHYVMIIGSVGGGLVVFSVLLCIVLRKRKRVNHHSTTNQKPSRGSTPSDSSLPSDRSRRFTLTEVKTATNNFNDNCVIGNGGFGKVYKGYIDNAATTVAIKRLNPSSSQGFHEFHTEIEMLSKLRHVHLVSLMDTAMKMVGSRDPLHKHVSTMVKGSIGPAIVPWVQDEQVNLAEWGKTCYRRGTLLELIDEKISDQIAPGCLRKFGEVANSCLHQEGCERPAMDEVVWGLEFALELQKGAEKTDGNVSDAMSDNQEVSFLMQEEVTTMG